VKRAGYDEVERKGLVEDGGKKMVSPTTLRVRGIIRLGKNTFGIDKVLILDGIT
jgi:hypothetical protein